MDKEVKVGKKLYILFIILPYNKKDLFMDLTERFAVNYHISFLASGSANDEIMDMLGLEDLTRSVTTSFIREDKAKDCLDAIEDKIKDLGINAIAFTIPLESLIGIKNYLFLANLGGQKWKKN